MSERAVYADPTFDEVARREAVELRRKLAATVASAEHAAFVTALRASPEYRLQRRRHIQRVMMQVQRGRG